MNSITYFYKNLLKKRLKENILSVTDTFADEIINSLTSEDNSSKYFSLVSTVQDQTRNLILKVLVDTFEEIDNAYAISHERKAKYYINKSKVKRTLVTPFGEITFSRNYYVSKLNKSKLFFIDYAFGLPKYDHYDPIVKGMAIDKAVSLDQAKAGREIGEQISVLKSLCLDRKLLHISRQSVHNWINKWKTPKSIYKPVNTPKTLYVMADEKFLGCQDLDGDIMSKCMIAFERVEKVGKHRNALKNKTVMTVYGSNPWGQFIDVLGQKYDFDKIENIKLIGDGGNWINSGISELKMSPNTSVERLLCEFHFKQAIHHITTNEDLRKELLDIFANKTKGEFEAKVLDILSNITEAKRRETINKKLNYILRNYKAIKAMIDSPIGSSMESHISHYIASMFASRPKGFSSEKINHYLMLNDYRINGVNIFNLYLQSYNNKEVITLNEQELNYSIFEKEKRIPVLDTRENTGLFKVLNSLSHWF